MARLWGVRLPKPDPISPQFVAGSSPTILDE
jgi:hypothetical protein